MAEVRCLPVTREHLPAIWPIVEPMLARAALASSGRADSSDIIAGAHKGTYLIWVVLLDGSVVASCTTRIVDYPKRRAMAVDWVGGTRMKEWLVPAMRVIKEHAVRNDCAHLEAGGRAAWAAMAKKVGWRQDYVAFKMELGDGH